MYYFLNHKHEYDINIYTLKTDINKLSIKDIHNIITQSMYYANFTEAHAFMENINFEIQKYVNTHKKEFFAYRTVDDFFRHSTPEIADIYILEKLISRLRTIDNAKKDDYTSLFKDDIKQAYFNFSKFDDVVNYLYKKLHKIILHSKTLFDYYFNLDSIAKQAFMLDDGLKRVFVMSYSGDLSGRKIID